MPDKANTASDFQTFQEQARSFVVKAKQKGLDNTAIANTINFMFGLYQMDEKNKITPYQQAQLDMDKARLDMDREKLSMAKQESSKQNSDWKLMDTNGDGVMEWVNTSTRQIEAAGSEKEWPNEPKSAGALKEGEQKQQEENRIKTVAYGQPGSKGYDVGMSSVTGKNVVWSSDVYGNQGAASPQESSAMSSLPVIGQNKSPFLDRLRGDSKSSLPEQPTPQPLMSMAPRNMSGNTNQVTSQITSMMPKMQSGKELFERYKSGK